MRFMIYCYSCNKSILFSVVSIIIMLWHIISYMTTILFDYGCIGYDVIILSYDLIHYLVSFDTKQACQDLTMFYGNWKQSILYSVPIAFNFWYWLFWMIISIGSLVIHFDDEKKIKLDLISFKILFDCYLVLCAILD